MWKFLTRLYRTYFSEQESGFFILLFLGIAILFNFIGQYLLPFFISVFIAFLLNEAVLWLKEKGIPHLLAVTGVFLLFLGITILALVFFLPFLWERLSQFLQAIPSMLEQTTIWLYLLPQNYPEFIDEQDVRSFVEALRGQVINYGQSILLSSISSLNNLVSFVIYTMLIMVMVFFILKDYGSLGRYLSRFLPKQRELMNQLGIKMKQEFINYVRGKFIEILIVAGVSWILFASLGLDFNFILALIVGLSVIIPYIGALLATIPVGIIAFAQFGTENMFFYILIAYGILQFFDGYILVPILFSEIVNIHPVSTILAILIFGSLWGIWGVLLAIPIATFIKALVQFWPRSQRLGH